jgi:hypothetical protein
MRIPNNIPASVRAALACAIAALTLLAVPSARAASKVLQFTATSTNTSGDVLTLDHPDLNGKSTLKLIVTQYWTGSYNDAPLGVQYSTALKKWQIVDENGATIPVGANFNVLIPETVVRVNAGATNSFDDGTFFPLEKENAKAVLLETHVINPLPSIGGVTNTNTLGFYMLPVSGTKPAPPSDNAWYLYAENSAGPLATAYNVADVTKDGKAGTHYSFVFTTTASNIGGDGAVITNPATDGIPSAVLFVNHVYDTAGQNRFDHNVGVYYSGGQWLIFTEDQTTMPAGISFFVDAFPAAAP